MRKFFLFFKPFLFEKKCFVLFLVFCQCLFLLPCLFLFLKDQELNHSFESVYFLQKKELLLFQKRTEKKTVFSQKDSSSLEKKLKNFSLCSRELYDLQKVLQKSFSKAFEEKRKALEERAEFLQTANFFSLVEGSSQACPWIHETLLLQKKPVELDEIDLKKLLFLVEESASFFQDFSLEKKKSASGAEYFEVDLKILKRDFLVKK